MESSVVENKCVADAINAIIYDIIRPVQAKWWYDIESGAALRRNIGEMLMLTVTELAEACEGHRKDLMDDHLPHRKMFEVELADAVIRIFDIAGGLGLDLGGAIVEKNNYNASRQDHTHEARRAANGKKY